MQIMDDTLRLSAVLEKPAEETEKIVIVLHGFSSTKDRPHNIQAAQAMREAGFATLRMDLYGHGESDGRFEKHTLQKWISNTMAAIDAVYGMGYREVWLSGHSQGGLTAALTAAMETDRIRGLILRAPAFMIPECARKGNLLGFDFDPDHIPERMEVIKGLELEGAYLRVAQTIHVEEAISRFKGPVLIIHGDQDDTVPPEDSRKAAEQYANAELAVMKGETHHFDMHPEEMQEIIRQWLAKYSF